MLQWWFLEFSNENVGKNLKELIEWEKVRLDDLSNPDIKLAVNKKKRIKLTLELKVIASFLKE